MDNQPHIRFAETPPGSPKSCLKGSRKLTFEEKGGDPSGEVSTSFTPPRSPRKSSKVCIRSPGDNSTPDKAVPMVAAPPPFVKPPDIQFSQHYDQATPPPNCTSNGAYDFEEPPEEINDYADPRQDPHLMEVASKFVNEIIEKATVEATNRQKVQPGPLQSIRSIARDILTTGRRSVWVQRAQGNISKWFTNMCVKAQSASNSIRT